MAKYLGIPIELTSGTSDVLTSGTSHAISTPDSLLYDTTANVFDNVKVGDFVLNTTTTTQATVTSIDLISAGYLNISSNIFAVVSQDYSIMSSLALYDATANVFDEVQVGDVVVNTTTMIQSTVTSVDSIALGILNISRSIFLVASQGYSTFAPNDDTRGNVLMSIEGYIAGHNNVGSLSVKFTQAAGANQQNYTSIGAAINDSFLTKLYLRWLEKLITTNATKNRLDIPLNEFYNNSSSTPRYIKTITLT